MDHYEEVKGIADFLRTKISLVPRIGVVCGSGLGGLADKLDQATVIEYKDIPGFKESTGEKEPPGSLFGAHSNTKWALWTCICNEKVTLQVFVARTQLSTHNSVLCLDV